MSLPPAHAGTQAVELAFADAHLCTGISGVKLLTAMQAHEVTNEVGGRTMGELTIFF